MKSIFVGAIVMLLLGFMIVGCGSENPTADTTDTADVSSWQSSDWKAEFDEVENVLTIEELRQIKTFDDFQKRLWQKQVMAAPACTPESLVVNEAFSWLNVPYKLGGTGQSGIDCSWLLYRVYQGAGVKHYPYMNVANIKQNSVPVWPNPGDYLLWQKDVRVGNTVIKLTGHVGIYLWNGYFIHASYQAGRVVIDHLYYSPYYGTGTLLNGSPYVAKWVGPCLN